MGSKFYLMTKDKTVAKQYFEGVYELTDEPCWGYSVLIAKTSGGWKPLFQAYPNLRSIKQLKTMYATGEFIIYDDSGTTYNWADFSERVLHFADNNPDAYGHLFPPKTDETGCVRGIPLTDVYGFNYPYKEHFADEDGFEFTDRRF